MTGSEEIMRTYLPSDKTGEVEVHAKYTDIFYILEGVRDLCHRRNRVGGKETAPRKSELTSMAR